MPVRRLKTHIFFLNVLLSTRRPYGWRIMNLFRKLKLSYTCSNNSSLPIPHPRNKARVKPPSVQSSPAHASHAQQFLSVNISNRAAQCQISWPATARKQQRDSPCLVLVTFEHEPSKSECGQANKKELRKNNRNICVTRICNPANGAKIIFETYN
jgi:hypothetical protein